MAANDLLSVSEHDWHSAKYVDAWITRDITRDAERRQRLHAMLAHAAFPGTPPSGFWMSAAAMGS